MSNTWLDINILEAYLKGTLDPKTMHLVEKEALEDPFIAEALEGLSQSGAYSFQISLLQKQLYERISQQKEEKKAKLITWQRLSIAAAASVVFISVAIMFMMRETNNNNTAQTANSKRKGVEVKLSPEVVDSLPEIAAIEDVPALAKSSSASSALIDTAVNDGPINTSGNIYTVEEAVDKAVANVREEGLAKNNVTSNQSLNEVVVKRFEVQEKKELQEAVVPLETKALVVVPNLEEVPVLPLPIGGVVAYDNYLKSNNKFHGRDSIGKAVLLSFIVLPDGSASEIKVTKGIKRKYNKEAIRLIANGPKWILPQNGNNRVSLEIKF